MITGCDEIEEDPAKIDASHDNLYTILQDGLVLCKWVCFIASWGAVIEVMAAIVSI